MTLDFQTWMRAVWESITEPSDMAGKVIGLRLPKEALWTALALIAVLNVLLLSMLQMLTPAPAGLEQGVFVLAPFAYAAIIGIFLALFVGGTYQVGRLLGGAGSLEATLAIIVWFQAISLTLEAIQLVLVLITPAIASLFGIVTLGILLWVFVNFVNVLHRFDSIGKAIVAIVLSLIATALISGIVLTILGVAPMGGVV